jgi:hypothetical protein
MSLQATRCCEGVRVHDGTLAEAQQNMQLISRGATQGGAAKKATLAEACLSDRQVTNALPWHL